MKDKDKTKDQLLKELKTLRDRVAELRRLDIKRNRLEGTLRKRSHDLRERVKELNCLYGISRLVEREGISSEELFQGIVDLIPPAWQYPEVTCAQIILEGQISKTNNFKETPWRQTCDIVVYGNRIGTLEVCYLEEKPERDEGPFLKEERSLIRGIAERLGKIIEHMRAEQALHTSRQQLRSLVSELSLIEERERRRIATELHDSVGHTLALCKIKLGTLQEPLSSIDHAGCLDEIYELINDAIQCARSLTFELSPPVLHELGLEAALEWLVERSQQKYGILIDFASDRQPKLLDHDVQILLFQATRELLVNVVKHAQARNARVSIRRDCDDIRLSVEDDGIGFDTSEVAPTTNSTDALGLFNIRERLNHIGGHLEIQSEPGHGTRVTIVVLLKPERK